MLGQLRHTDWQRCQDGKLGLVWSVPLARRHQRGFKVNSKTSMAQKQGLQQGVSSQHRCHLTGVNTGS